MKRNDGCNFTSKCNIYRISDQGLQIIDSLPFPSVEHRSLRVVFAVLRLVSVCWLDSHVELFVAGGCFGASCTEAV